MQDAVDRAVAQARQRERALLAVLQSAGEGGASAAELEAKTGVPERAVRRALTLSVGRRAVRRGSSGPLQEPLRASRQSGSAAVASGTRAQQAPKPQCETEEAWAMDAEVRAAAEAESAYVDAYEQWSLARARVAAARSRSAASPVRYLSGGRQSIHAAGKAADEYDLAERWCRMVLAYLSLRDARAALRAARRMAREETAHAAGCK